MQWCDPRDIAVHYLTPSTVHQYLAWLSEILNNGDVVSVDTETGSVNTPQPYPKDYIRLYQIGTANEAWALDVSEWRGLVRYTQERLNEAGNTVWGANIVHDQRSLYWGGLPTLRWDTLEDLVFYDRITRPDQWSHGLKQVGVRELGAWVSYGQQELSKFMKENGYTWETVPVAADTYWFYGGVDCCINVRAGQTIKPDNAPPRGNYEVEMAYLQVTEKWERKGLRVCEEALEHAENLWTLERDLAHKELIALGYEKLNPASNKQIRKLFEEIDDHTPPVISDETDLPLYNKSALQILQKRGGLEAAVAQHLMKYRHYNSWVNNYVYNIRSMEVDGFVHPTVNSMDARTGRSTVTKPALQTLPADKVARNIFKPRHVKGLLYACDYDSQEVRILGALSGDVKIHEFFLGGGDGDYHFYVANAAGIERSVAKTVNFARAYGAGVPNMAATAGVSVEVMQDVINQIDAAFPGIPKWLDLCRDAAISKGYVDLPYGTRLRIPRGGEYTKAANSIIQGHGAAVLKRAATRLYAAGYGDVMLMAVHDELLFSTPAPMEEMGFNPKDIEEIMRDEHLSIPLTATISQPLDRWGDKYSEED